DPLTAGVYGGNPHKISYSAAFPELDKSITTKLFTGRPSFLVASLGFDAVKKSWFNRLKDRRGSAHLHTSPTQLHPYFRLPHSPALTESYPKYLAKASQFNTSRLSSISFKDGMQQLPMHLQRVITANNNRFYTRNLET